MVKMKGKAFSPQYYDMIGRIVVGRYQIVRRLATGGMGIVYLARARGAAGFAKPVVIKSILPGLAKNKEFAGMFIREAQILSHLKHPGIVDVIDFAEEDDAYLMVMEYVQGFQLGQWDRYLKSKGMKIPTNIAILSIISILDALHYAHMMKRPDGEPMNIIHRDISPSNILINTDGHFKLVDFGIARMTNEEQGYQTQTRSFKGKLSYTAPEIFRGQSASIASDVYACGVVLHEILVGSNEFRGVDYPETFGKVLNHSPSSILDFRDDVPDDIDAVLGKVLAKKKEDRYASAKEFAKALRDIKVAKESQTSELLISLIQRDFTDDMADYLGVETLNNLDSAWRHPSINPQESIESEDESFFADKISDGKQSEGPPIEDEDEDEDTVTAFIDPNSSVSTVPNEIPSTGFSHNKSHRKVILSIFIFCLVVLSFFVSIGFLNRKQEKRSFMLVQSFIDSDSPMKSPSASDDLKPSIKPKVGKTAGNKFTEREDANAGPVGASSPTMSIKPKALAKKPRPYTKRDKQPDVYALTRAFKRQQSKIHSCFKSHAVELHGKPEISILFQVNKRGQVDESRLSPKALASTELGKCLLDIADKTRFPQQKDQISFRIPVTAWRARSN